MLTADGRARLLRWLPVRHYAVPAAMIDKATTRRLAGDWAGACAAAHVDVDFSPRDAASLYGREVATRLRDDLRHLAPDLLRWHLPRVGPDGLLRPGLTILLARYGPVDLVARTPPGWAAGGQRFSLALRPAPSGWARPGPPSYLQREPTDDSRVRPGRDSHPHPRPDRRFRLDLHRHLWDARQASDLRERSGFSANPGPPADDALTLRERSISGAELWPLSDDARGKRGNAGLVPPGLGCATDRWAAEATLLRIADDQPHTHVSVRLGSHHRLLIAPDGRLSRAPRNHSGPVLPDAATWIPPDVELLRAGLITLDALHPLVAAALAPDGKVAPTSDHPATPSHQAPLTAGHSLSSTSSMAAADRPSERPDGMGSVAQRVDVAGVLRLPRPGAAPGLPGPRAERPGVHYVRCGGRLHRVGLVDGVLSALDHTREELGREDLLLALGGPVLPCLQAMDDAHRHPEDLAGVRARLDHGDTAGAVAVVEQLLGPDAVLRDGLLHDELTAAAGRLVDHGLFRAGLATFGPPRTFGQVPPRPRRRHLLPR